MGSLTGIIVHWKIVARPFNWRNLFSEIAYASASLHTFLWVIKHWLLNNTVKFNVLGVSCSFTYVLSSK